MAANDTGPLHLAAALGRPVIAPYTCTKVALNGPYGHAARTAETSLACGGSYLTRCPRGLACMAELTPDRRDFIITYVVEEGERDDAGA